MIQYIILTRKSQDVLLNFDEMKGRDILGKMKNEK